MLVAGQLVGGKFRLLRAIGEGGMACVWAARHELLDRDVALKLAPVSGDPVHTARFLREARIIGRFEHANIVGVIDAGELPDEGYLFLGMELLHGKTFSARLDGSELPASEYLPILIAVASGLEVAHAAGIVHRDVKPENVVLAEVGRQIVPKLLDFGISLATSANGDRITIDGQILGTPAYMSPEQAQGSAAIGPQADIWAVGVMLYEAIAGRQPFVAPNYHALLRQIIDDAPRPLPASAPPDLAAIAMRCLAKRPADRYPDAAPLRRALEAALVALEDRPGAAMSAPASSSPASPISRRQGATLRSGGAMPLAEQSPVAWAPRRLAGQRRAPRTLASVRLQLALLGALAVAAATLGAARASQASARRAAHLGLAPSSLAAHVMPPVVTPADPGEACALRTPTPDSGAVENASTAGPQRTTSEVFAAARGTRVTSPGF